MDCEITKTPLSVDKQNLAETKAHFKAMDNNPLLAASHRPMLALYNKISSLIITVGLYDVIAPFMYKSTSSSTSQYNQFTHILCVSTPRLTR
jgi:hypothetical protein